MKTIKILIVGSVVLMIIIGSISFAKFEEMLQLEKGVNNDAEIKDIQEINIALWDYEVVGYDKKLIEEFAKYNPNIKINVIDTPNDKYDNNLTMMLSSGKDIDVFYARTLYEYNKIVKNDFARPLDDLIDSHEIDTKVYEESVRINNNIYGIPYRSDFMVLYYNKNIFDRNNVAYPTYSTTWEEYREIAKALMTGNKEDEVYGIFIEPQLMNRFVLSMIREEDFNILNDDLSMLRDGLEFIQNIQYVDKTAVSYAKNKEIKANQLVFAKGRSGMSMNGTWFLNYLINDRNTRKYNLNWGMVNYPYYTEDKANQIIYTPVCINKKSKNVKASWEFVKFITGKKGARILASETILPGYIDDDIIAILEEQTEFPKEGLSMLRNYKVKPLLDTTELYDKVSKMIFEEIELIITNNKSIDMGIADMIKKRQEILGNTKVQ